MVVNAKKIPKALTKPGAQSGMLMVELLVAILIFSIGLLGLIAMQTATVQTASSVENRTTAANLANELVTQMWLRKTADPAASGLSSDITAWKDKVSASRLPNAVGSVTRDGQVTSVTIQYKLPSKTAAENASQYVTQVVIP